MSALTDEAIFRLSLGDSPGDVARWLHLSIIDECWPLLLDGDAAREYAEALGQVKP